MIALTRLNGNPLTINSDLIKFVESSPDTMLTLVTGEKIVIRESCDEVIQQALAWRVRILQATALTAEHLQTAQAAANAIAAQTACNMEQSANQPPKE
ncbi:MAG: flagellar FlbD family protein [Acidobacteriaceae bacterium]